VIVNMHGSTTVKVPFFSSRKCHGNTGTCKGLIFSLKILSVISKI
jgi:hypothetical protein